MERREKATRALAVMKRQGLALTGLAMVLAGLVWAAVALAATSVSVDGPKDGDATLEKEKAKFLGRYVIKGERQNINGYSLDRVLGIAGVGRAEWTRVFVNGIEVARDEEFSGKRVPAFAFRVKTDDVFFIRPKQGEEPAVTKAANSFDLTYRIPIEIESTPDLDEAKAGDTVTFTAALPGPDSDYTFDWDANGQTGTGRKFEYTLPSAGGDVTVNVEGTRNGNVQAEETISTSVKKPPPEDTGSGTSGTGFGSGSYDGYTPPTDYPDTTSTPTPTPNFPDAPEPPDDTTTVPEEDLGTSVTGELLSATSPLPPSSGKDSSSPTATPESEDTPVESEREEVTAPGALIAAGVIVGLMGLGAGRELDNVRPRRFLWRPDLGALRRLSPPWK